MLISKYVSVESSEIENLTGVVESYGLVANIGG